MPLRSFLGFILRDMGGHSLIEAVVATALVVTVLVPLSGVAVYLFTVRQNEGPLVGLAIAQQFMEETLHERSYASRQVSLDRDRWVVQKSVTQQGRQVTIVIRVFRRNQPQPLAELMTVRLLQ